MNRRQFVVGFAAATAGSGLLKSFAATALRSSAVTLVIPADEALGKEIPVRRAVEQLRNALRVRGLESRVSSSLGDAPRSDSVVIIAGPASRILRDARVMLPEGSEAIAIAPVKIGQRDLLAIGGSDARALVYGLTDVAEAIALNQPADKILRPSAALLEKPANPIRSRRTTATSFSRSIRICSFRATSS